MTDLETLAERQEPDFTLDGERPMLRAWLDYHRSTLATKCLGLTPEQLRERSAPPSSLSLHGLVRHMTEVERGWFQRVLPSAQLDELYCDDSNPDGDFDDVDAADFDADLQRFAEAIEASRANEAAAESLEVIGHGRRGHEFTLRWIMVHMIEEYARHNGHADLLRERIDGAVGD
jgi:uncharacterized damage-inducible protein DinB